MKDKWNFAKGSLLLLTIVFFLGEMVIFYWGMVYTQGSGLVRLRVLSADEFAAVQTKIFGINDELNRLREELNPLIKKQDNDFQKALIVNEWVMNQISGTEGDLKRSRRTPYTILTAMREGKTGASCGYRALLYLGALKSIGMESRMVSLSTYDGGGTHATVEVLIDEWVVIDPTFNVYFVINGKPASAVELHQLVRGSANNFEVIEGREALGSVKFDSPDYLLTFFYNVSIYERRHFFAWQALPILQYFFGVTSAILGDGESTIESAVKRRHLMVSAYNFAFPIGFSICFIGFVVVARCHKRHTLKL